MIGGPPKEQTHGSISNKVELSSENTAFWLVAYYSCCFCYPSELFGSLHFLFFFDRVDPCVFDVLVPSAAALIDDVIRSCSQQKRAHKGLLLSGPRCAISVSVMNLPTVKGHPFLCISLVGEKKE